ncbi:ATP-binding protein [Undibacterium parvum]|uniref:ATP-binding protein n=1 Tax=Undibacterium parvum TaxID=401471 RepID=UPI0014777705|nr:ATP-binding protein [Undibacterium parvum]
MPKVFHTITGKLLIFGIVLQSLLLASYFLVTSNILRESMASNLATSIRTTSQIIHLGIAPYAVEQRYDILQDFFNELISGANEDLRYIVVLDQNNHSLVATGISANQLPLPSENEHAAIAAGIYHVRQPVLLSGNQIGQVQFGLSTLKVVDLIERMIRLALLVSLCGILVTTVLLTVFGHKIKQRFSLLMLATQAIVSGDYRKKVPDTGKDELAQLAAHFNIMSAGLELREKKFLAVFNAAPIPMLLLKKDQQNPDYHRSEQNIASRQMFGELTEKTSGMLTCSDSDNLSLTAIIEKENHLIATELDLQVASGISQPFLVSGQCFEIEHSNYLILASMDISDLRNAQNELLALNRELELRVAQRTIELEQRNQDLDTALQTIQQAQKQLIQSEKLSSLGSMVAGVAHELNTPIGNALTVASTLVYNQKQFKDDHIKGLSKSELNNHLDENELAGQLLVSNLQRAAALVSSFKAVAVDRSSSQRREFLLSDIIDEIILSTTPMFRTSKAILSCELDPSIRMDSFPGPLGQVLTNLLNNALIHGIKSGVGQAITVRTSLIDSEHLLLSVRDDGAGIPPENLGKIFDPFFTTTLGKGGSGLGLNIVYNLVSGLLGGQIQVYSKIGEGSEFLISLPLHAPKMEARENVL